MPIDGLAILISGIRQEIKLLKDTIDGLTGVDNSTLNALSSAIDTLSGSLTSLAGDVDDLELEVDDHALNITNLQAEETAKNTRDTTTSVTLDLAAARIFSKTIIASRQWTLSNEKTGDEFTVYCPAGSGSLNAQLFAITGKTPTVHAKIDNYVNTKPAIITGKILFSDASNFTIAYFVTQPLA